MLLPPVIVTVMESELKDEAATAQYTPYVLMTPGPAGTLVQPVRVFQARPFVSETEQLVAPEFPSTITTITSWASVVVMDSEHGEQLVELTEWPSSAKEVPSTTVGDREVAVLGAIS
jgi:hypothetical protein